MEDPDSRNAPSDNGTCASTGRAARSINVRAASRSRGDDTIRLTSTASDAGGGLAVDRS